MKTIAIFYKCRCMAAEASVEVPARPEGSDISIWMQVVQGMIGLDHGQRSPRCSAAEMEYAKIPLDNDAPGIGVARKVN